MTVLRSPTMKLDRLKEIAADDDVLKFPSRHAAEYGRVMKALPGLLRVCDAFLEPSRVCEEITEEECRGKPDCGACVKQYTRKKLEELLG